MLSELTARGVNDVVVAVVASPQSTVVGGATESVRELVAAWEERDVMAREVAVDVASHSPQVDPILAELTEALAELAPMAPQVPYYSATMFDPRERARMRCRVLGGQSASHRAVRRRGAGGAGGRLPGLRRVVPAPAADPRGRANRASSSACRLAALAGMRREQQLPHGLRGFLADLYGAGAAVDFSVLYPHGRLVDSPLPAWTHRRCC